MLFASEYWNHCYYVVCNGAFTLPENETEAETDVDNKFVEPNENLCRHLFLSLCSMNTCTQSYATYFLSVSLSVSLQTDVNMP